MRNQPRTLPLRIAGLLLLLLFLAGQGAAAAADARSDPSRSCALTRGTGGRSLSARPDFAPEVGPAALPPSIDELTPASFVVRVRLEDAPSVPAPRTARTAVPLPRGPPLPA